VLVGLTTVRGGRAECFPLVRKGTAAGQPVQKPVGYGFGLWITLWASVSRETRGAAWIAALSLVAVTRHAPVSSLQVRGAFDDAGGSPLRYAGLEAFPFKTESARC
jgi:hypothetical protein